MNETVVELSRLQFAATAMYHFLFAPLMVAVLTGIGSNLAMLRKTLAAFVASGLTMTGIIGTAGVALFPFIMPSSADPRSSLTVWDSVSSHLTLGLMFWATVIFMPLIVIYTSWAYKVMSGKVTERFIEAHDKAAY
ncbi:MAG: hypothetical protein HGA75_10640 [Thiobacillus sp.]|nr:hypothetical protein [Thiobacillus sp.]